MRGLSAEGAREARQIASASRGESGWLGEITQAFPVRTGDGGLEHRALPAGVKSLSDNYVDQSVITQALADLAVTRAKIAPAAVDSNEINALAVTRAKIANRAVGSEEITELAVTRAKIAPSAVDTNEINNAAVVSGKIAAEAVNEEKLGSGLKGGPNNNVALRRIGLGDGPSAAGATHSHSTSQALRFESLPKSGRDVLLAARAHVRGQLLNGSTRLDAAEIRAMRVLLLGLFHIGIDGLTETAEERMKRRAHDPGFDGWLTSRVMEMYYSEWQEGTTAKEEGIPLVTSAQTTEAQAAVGRGAVPRFVRELHKDIAT